MEKKLTRDAGFKFCQRLSLFSRLWPGRTPGNPVSKSRAHLGFRRRGRRPERRSRHAPRLAIAFRRRPGHRPYQLPDTSLHAGAGLHNLNPTMHPPPPRGFPRFGKITEQSAPSTQFQTFQTSRPVIHRGEQPEANHFCVEFAPVTMSTYIIIFCAEILTREPIFMNQAH